MIKFLVVPVALVGTLASVAGATDYYVQEVASMSITPCDTNLGTSPTVPFRTLQRALLAVSNGDRIFVAPGDYHTDDVPGPSGCGGSRNSNLSSSFNITASITIEGTTGVNLLGNIGTDRAEHVITIGAGLDVSLTSLTISGGDARAATDTEGGLVRADAAGTVILTDCNLSGGKAFKGGAIYFTGDTLKLENTTIAESMASTLTAMTEVGPMDGLVAGGGVFSLADTTQLLGCFFDSCAATSLISAVSTLGGGLYVQSEGALQCVDTRFFKCTATGVNGHAGDVEGGGAWVLAGEADFRATNFNNGSCSSTPRIPDSAKFDSCGTGYGLGGGLRLQGAEGGSEYTVVGYLFDGSPLAQLASPGLRVDGLVALELSHCIFQNLATYHDSETMMFPDSGAIDIRGEVDGKLTNTLVHHCNGGPGSAVYVQTRGEAAMQIHHFTVADCESLDEVGGSAEPSVLTNSDISSSVIWYTS